MGPYVSVRLLLLRLQRKHCIYVYAVYVCLHACVGADKAIDIKPLLAEVEQRARAYVRTFKWALMYAYLYSYVCVLFGSSKCRRFPLVVRTEKELFVVGMSASKAFERVGRPVGRLFFSKARAICCN